MSKIYRMIFTFLTLLVFIAGGVNAQDAPAPTISEALREQIINLEQVTEALRGLDAQSEIELAFPTRAEASEYLMTAIANELPEEVIAEQMTFYTAFKLLPADYDLLGELTALYQDQVAGFYDTETKIMNVILMSGDQPGDTLPLLDRIIFAHEYIHALQDQYFNLALYIEAVDPDVNGDAVLARIAVVEGDATAVMNEYTVLAVEENPVLALIQVGLGALQAGNLTLPPGTPRILEQELTWPYLAGEQFIRAVYADGGGWDAVNALYTEEAAPQSSEHIVDPASYLAGDAPVTITLPEASAPEGWSMAYENTLGAFYLREWLIALDWERDAVDLAVDGWGGDRFQIYRNADGELAYQLVIEWDRSVDAQDFMDGLATWQEALMIESDDACFAVEDATYCVQTDDTRTLVTYAPQQSDAEALLTALN